MADSPVQPTMQDILDALDRLGDRVAQAPYKSRVDRFVLISVRRVNEELRRFIPGLDLQPDREAARFLYRASYAALEDGHTQDALSRALQGLACSPHHPGLWYMVASAYFEFGVVEDAMRCLRHVLWIHPGHSGARRDLEALSKYVRERWPEKERPPVSDVDHESPDHES